jgi:hypothetical protein
MRPNLACTNDPFAACTASFLIELASRENFTVFRPLESMLSNAIPIILRSAAVGLAQANQICHPARVQESFLARLPGVAADSDLRLLSGNPSDCNSSCRGSFSQLSGLFCPGQHNYRPFQTSLRAFQEIWKACRTPGRTCLKS